MDLPGADSTAVAGCVQVTAHEVIMARAGFQSYGAASSWRRRNTFSKVADTEDAAHVPRPGLMHGMAQSTNVRSSGFGALQ